VSGSLLVTKAEELAKRFSDGEFVCSAGCVDRFKLRYKMSLRKVSGVNSDMTTEWLDAVWPSVREGYADSDVFYADGTRIFLD
jgi:hypothetical protein